MFVLERILRGLCEETLAVQSSYYELLEVIRTFKGLKVDSDYHEKLRLVIEPYLNRALHGLVHEVPNNLRIILLANDFRIRPNMDNVDWIKVVKELIEAKELSLLVRLLRYLRVCGQKDILEDQIPLLLLNSIRKLLVSNDQRIIGQVLQLIKLVDFGSVDDGILRVSLMKLLRGNMNDKIKWMILRILKRECEDEKEVIGMLEVKKASALIHSILKDEYKEVETHPIESIPKSSSKVVNLLNGHFEGFSAVEKSVLDSKLSRDDCLSLSEYEKYISSTTGEGVRDPNLARELLRIDRMSVDQYSGIQSCDAELIVLKTKDPEVFWKFLGQCDEFVTDKMEEIELRREFYEHYKPLIDFENSRLPVAWYFFKLIKEFEADLMQYKQIGVELYDKYANNFDGSASVFLLNQ